jgi:lipopolysaccharide export system protein LptC
MTAAPLRPAIAAPRVPMAPPGRRPPPGAASPQGAGRRLFVRVAKRLLPAAAILLLALVALWPQLDGSDEARRLTFRRGAEPPADTLRVRDARFQGVDEQGRPYTVTAAEAAQATGADLVDLVRPQADMTLSDGAWVLLAAREGAYARDVQVLDLRGAVTLNHDAGYQVVTEAARVKLRDHSAEGESPVAAQGPFGTLEGTGFVLTESGQVIVVTGPARLVLQETRE